MKRKPWEPEQIFEEYETGRTFKSGLGRKGLYEQGKINERFYIGDQWHGARCGNDRPLVLAVSTNDGLGASGENLARLFQRKHYFFVPYGQDDPIQKPSSLKADLSSLPAALEAALQGRQLQPVLLGQRGA